MPLILCCRPEYDTRVQFIVEMDDFFLEYLETKNLVLELHRAEVRCY